MQTFVPEITFEEIAKSLDYRRLGKQRVECLQILRANLGITDGWRNHPASKMWRNSPAGLCAYGVAMCAEWIARGYKDTCTEKMIALIEPNAEDLPSWWGRTDIIESHRSNLIRKYPEFYRPRWAETPDNLPYVWVEA